MKVLVVTACGAKKNSQSLQAYKLYKSTRIKAVYNRRGSCDMSILSAKYGLVDAHEVIEPYEQVINEERAKELVPTVALKLKDYDYVVFFKGGARRAYLSYMRSACESARKNLVTLGYANMGGINDLPQVLEFLRQEDWERIHRIKHARVYEFSNKPCSA